MMLAMALVDKSPSATGRTTPPPPGGWALPVDISRKVHQGTAFLARKNERFPQRYRCRKIPFVTINRI